MRRSPITVALLIGAWAVFLLAIVWPTVALLGRSIAEGKAPEGGFTFSARQLGLLWRSTWLAGVATVAGVLVSLPGAYVVGRTGQLGRRPFIVAVLMASLLCPPMVYAFGWERLLPVSFNPYVRCVGVWALWAWPIPALLIGTGWSRGGRRAYEAAILVATPATAFGRVVLPVLRRHIALSVLILFLLFFGDYGVPHACGLLLYSTELLGWAASSRHVIDTVWPALLSVVVTGLALLGTFLIWRRHAGADEDQGAAPAEAASSRSLPAIAVGCLGVSWLLPIGALIGKLDSPGAIAEAFQTYNRDLGWSLGLAMASGLLVTAMGVGVAAGRWLKMVALVWAVAFAALPGALIGEALVAAYNLSALWWFYDYWPIVMLSYVARFGCIGVMTAILVTRQSDPDVVDQARTDGAGAGGILRYIQIPMSFSTLLCCAGVVAAFCVAEVPTTTLVRVPAFAPIAHVVIEKFHRFEDGMLISLSLGLVGASLLAVILAWWALRRRTGDSSA